MSGTLRIYFAFRSPYSRLGLHKVARMALPENIQLELVPFLGPPEGSPFYDPAASPAKLAYYAEDVPRMTMQLGLPVRQPDPFEVSYTRANRTFMAGAALGKGLEIALAISDARWGAGENISNMQVLAACCQAAGLPEDMPRQAKRDPSLEALLEDSAALAVTDQVFGVPFAVLVYEERREAFWGQDRFDLLAERLNALGAAK